MTKYKAKQALPYLLLLVLTAGLCWLLVLRHGIFGAKVDWISQHSVFPAYFRQQFYDTGQLFPEFAPHIGAGQNIYHFSYYGLLNPFVLLSYLLPFVKMSSYMMVVQFLCLLASVELFYFWLKKQGIAEKICFSVTVMFLLAGPMIFHSYNQIMFVQYMPFLCGGLLGVDRYFSLQKKTGCRGAGLIMCTFFMIMTSFYFSLGGLLTIGLYGLYRFFKNKEEQGETVTFLSLVKEGCSFGIILLLPVLMAGILLIPTAMALTGRESISAGISFRQLFLPQFRIKGILYSPYGIGLTSFALTVLAALVWRKSRAEKVTAFCCLFFLGIPLWTSILNGGLYLRDKVWIPLLPLLCFLVAVYLDHLDKEKENLTCWSFLPYIFPLFLIGLQGEGVTAKGIYLLVDSMSMLLAFSYLYRRKKIGMLLLSPLLFLVVYQAYIHPSLNRATEKSFYKEMTKADTGKQMEKIYEKETGFYRMECLGNKAENGANINRIRGKDQYVSSIYSSSYHQVYHEFRKNIFRLEEPFRNYLMESPSPNPVFQRFMGIKYLFSKRSVPGYTLKKKGKEGGIYASRQVFPVIYGTDQVLHVKNHQDLSFPCNQLAFLFYGFVHEETEKTADEITQKYGTLEKQIKKAAKEKEVTEQVFSQIARNSVVKKANDSYRIQTADTKTILLELGKTARDKVLFLQMEIENDHPQKDVSVFLDDAGNTLTAKNHFYYNDNRRFTFAVPLKDGKAKLRLGKGSYRLSRGKAYLAELPSRKKQEGGTTPVQNVLQLDKEKTRGNQIMGTLSMDTAGYMLTTIPYETNFSVYIDGEKVKTEKVNMVFLGAKLTKGEHKVKILYHAPGMMAGRICSTLGCLLFLCCLLRPYGQKRINRRNSFPNMLY